MHRVPNTEKAKLQKLDLAMDWVKRHLFYIVVFAAAAGEAFNRITLDWVGVVLLLIAGLPTWLPTFARHVKALRKTDDGWELEIREDVLGLLSTQIEKVIDVHVNQINTSDRLGPVAPDDFANLSLHARRVLKALWHYQRELFGVDSVRRWGFGVGRQAPNYASFAIGVRELEWDRLVYADPRGLSYLTNEGIEFCKREREALDREALYYDSFVAAPNG